MTHDVAPTLDVARTLDVALVNNMPDAAFVDTERQYTRLLDAALGAGAWNLRRFALAGVARTGRVADVLADRYRLLAELWADPPDVLIVTGAEPRATALAGEAYWDGLVTLLTWADAHVATVALSCLAAHASLLVADGVDRTPLADKLSGVYHHDVRSGHPLTAGLPTSMDIPHSRANGVPTGSVQAAGYEILLASDRAGWCAASRPSGRGVTLLVQGHPEYAGGSLVGEYARDARRFLRGDRVDPPRLPEACVAPLDRPGLEELHTRVVHRRIGVDELASPLERMAARAPDPWSGGATALYANWLAVASSASRPVSSDAG